MLNQTKKKREVIDTRNQAESMIHGAEKSLSDLGDKAEESAKKEVEDAVSDLKTALEGDDVSIIKEKTSALSAVMMKMGEAAYKANEANNAESADNRQFWLKLKKMLLMPILKKLKIMKKRKMLPK